MRIYLLLTLIVFLGFLARLYKIDAPLADWHSWRQTDTASVSRLYLKNGVDLLYPKYQDISFLQTGKDNPQGFRFVEFPIYNAVHALLAKTFPFLSLEIWGRLLSIFCSSISTLLMFILGKRFLGWVGGILSAFFFAFLPFNIYFSRVILPEPMSVMFSLGSLVIFLSWVEKERQWKIITSGILLALALLIKPFAIFFALPMLWMLVQQKGFKFFQDRFLWVFGIISIIPLLAWRLWILRHPEGIPFYSWMYEGVLRFKPAFWRWIFGERIGRLILGEWGLILFASGILAKSKEKLSYFPIVMFSGAFLYMFIMAEANVRHDYYQIFIIPAVCLVLARGTLSLWNSEFLRKYLTRGLIIFSIVMMFGMSWYQVKELYKINHPEILEAGKVVATLAPPDALVVAPYNGDTTLLYQTQRSGWPYLMYPIEKLVSMGATYYVSVSPKDSETQDAYRKYIVLKETDQYLVLKLEPKPKP